MLNVIWRVYVHKLQMWRKSEIFIFRGASFKKWKPIVQKMMNRNKSPRLELWRSNRLQHPYRLCGTKFVKRHERSAIVTSVCNWSFERINRVNIRMHKFLRHPCWEKKHITRWFCGGKVVDFQPVFSDFRYVNSNSNFIECVFPPHKSLLFSTRVTY